MAGQPDVVRGRDHHVGDHPALEAGHPVGQHPGRDTADRGERLGDQRQRGRRPLVGGERARTATGRTPAPRRTGTTPVRLGPSRSPDTHPVTTPPGGGRGDARCATTLSLGDQAAEVTCRPLVAGGTGDRQHPLGRHPTLRTSRPVRRPARSPHRNCATRSTRGGGGSAGLELLDDPFDGLVGGAAQLGGASVRPDLLIGRNDVHAVPRRLQWNSPVVAMSGWHLHRHHRGPQFLIDTTNTGWGLLSGHQWGPPLGHQWGLFHGHGHGRQSFFCEWPRQASNLRPLCSGDSSDAFVAVYHRSPKCGRLATGQPRRRHSVVCRPGATRSRLPVLAV